jgi:hypothetical protein
MANQPGFTLNRTASPGGMARPRAHQQNYSTAMSFSFSLDQASRLRLRIFAFKLLIAIPVLVAFASQRNYPMLGMMSFFCYWNGIFAGMAALLQRHKVNAAFLTAWDEMAAFFGCAALMRLVDAVTR